MEYYQFVVALQFDSEALEGFRWCASVYANWRAHESFIGSTTSYADQTGAFEEAARIMSRWLEAAFQQGPEAA